MEIINDINYSRKEIEILLIKSLNKSIERTIRRCHNLKKKPQEPDFIADLTINWTKDLSKILELILESKYKIGITSVYCHQKPIVDIGGKSKPELGDVLLVLRYTDIRGKSLYNSLLYQAKRPKRHISSIPSNELHQLKLYEEWPEFKYLRAGILNGNKRNIHPKSISNGAKYLLINDINSWHYPYYPYSRLSTAIPNLILAEQSDFSSELIQFLTNSTGRNFSPENAITEDWSKMIWDLLQISKNKMSRRKNSGIEQFPRVHDVSFYDSCYFMSLSNSVSYYDDIRNELQNSEINIDPNFDINDDDAGISTIFIEVERNDDN